MARLLALGVILLVVIAGELGWLICRKPPAVTERVIVEEAKIYRLGDNREPTAAEKSEQEAREAINQIQRVLTGKTFGSVPLTIKTPYAWQLINEHFEAVGWCVSWEKRGDGEWTVNLARKVER